MSFRNQIFQNYLWRGIYFAVVFLVNVFISRNYQPASSGWINFIINNFALAIAFGSISFEVAVLYFGITKQVSKSKLATFSLLWVIVTTVLFYFTSQFFVSKTPFILSKGLLTYSSVCYFAGIMLINFFTNMFLMDQQFSVPYFLLIVINVIVICCVPNINLLGLNFTEFDFLYFYFTSFLLQGVLILIAYVLYANKLKFELPNIKELRLMAKYASIAFLGNISYFLLLKVDFWTLRIYNRDLSEYGNYTNASRVLQMFLMIAMIAGSSLFVNVANKSEETKGRRIMMKLARILICFYLVVILVFAVFGSTIFATIYGDSFSRMYYPFLAFSPGLIFICLICLFGAYFGGINRIKVNVITNIIGLTTILALGVFILPHNSHIVTSALICSFGYFAALCYAIFMYRKENDFKVKELFAFRLSDFDFLQKILKRK